MAPAEPCTWFGLGLTIPTACSVYWIYTERGHWTRHTQRTHPVEPVSNRVGLHHPLEPRPTKVGSSVRCNPNIYKSIVVRTTAACTPYNNLWTWLGTAYIEQRIVTQALHQTQLHYKTVGKHPHSCKFDRYPRLTPLQTTPSRLQTTKLRLHITNTKPRLQINTKYSPRHNQEGLAIIPSGSSPNCSQLGTVFRLHSGECTERCVQPGTSSGTDGVRIYVGVRGVGG